MNLRQQLFVRYYLETCNATESAKLAGYSSKTAYSIGEENLKKPEIKKAIQDQQQQLIKRSYITKDRIIEELARYAFRDCTNRYDDVSPKDALQALSKISEMMGLDEIENSLDGIRSIFANAILKMKEKKD